MSAPQSPPPWAGPPAGNPPTGGAGVRRLFLAGGAAVLVLVVGTFLPWIRSGRVSRNSYEIAGVGARRLDGGPWSAAVLEAWPYLGPLWAVVAVLAILGSRRTAAVSALLLAVLTALVAMGGLYLAVRVDTAAIRGVALGPAVTLAGALGAAVASVAVLRTVVRRAG